MSSSQSSPLIIGWRERVDLPEWGVRRIRAKIDTGARTSAIHVGQIEDLPDGRIRFEIIWRERPTRRTKWVEADPIRETIVRPSSGQTQQRPVFRTKMILGGVEREIDVSVVCRRGMLCRMLIGRTALDGAFLVDPSRKYIASGPRRAKRKGPSR